MMATDDANEPDAMPQPDLSADITLDGLCDVLGSYDRRATIQQIAFQGWVAVEDLKTDSAEVLEERGVIEIRGEAAERGVNFAAAKTALNALVLSQGPVDEWGDE